MIINLLDNLRKQDPLKSPHRGIVVDNDDPKKLGRVKVFIKGIMEETDIAKLPWVYPQMSAGLGGRKDSSFFAVPEKNSELVIRFQNGDIYSPYIAGRWHNEQSNQQSLFDEDYPDSYGHMDSTGTFLRINKKEQYTEFKHVSGFYCKVDKDGNLDIHVPGTVTWNIQGDSHLRVDGDYNQEIHGNLNEKIEKEKNVKIAENHNFHCEGDDARKVEGNQEWILEADQIHKIEGDSCIGVVGTMWHEAADIHHNLGTSCSPREPGSDTPGAALSGFANTPQNKLNAVGCAAAGFMDDLMELTDELFPAFISSMLNSAIVGLGTYIISLFSTFNDDLEGLMRDLQNRTQLANSILEEAEQIKTTLEEETKDSDTEE